MGQWSNYAAVKDAPTELSREVCALDMGHRSGDAVAKDVQKMSSTVECALGMVQRGQRKHAAVKDVQIRL